MSGAGAARRSMSWSGLALTLLAAALWGLAPVATKSALQGFSPESIGFVRLAVAALLFAAFGGLPGGGVLTDRWLWLAGVALGADFIVYNYGLQRTTAGVSGLVINVEVVSTIGFAVWLLGERLTARRVAGCVVTLLGVVVVNLPGAAIASRGDGAISGNLMVMAAGISWSLFAVAQRRARTDRHLFHRLATIFAIAALTVAPTLLHPAAWNVRGGIEPTLMLAVLTLLCTGLVYLVYAHAQELVDVSVLAVLLCSIPVFAVLFAAALLGEPLTRQLLAGGAVVLVGIVVIAAEREVPEEAPGVLAPESIEPPMSVAASGDLDSSQDP